MLHHTTPSYAVGRLVAVYWSCLGNSDYTAPATFSAPAALRYQAQGRTRTVTGKRAEATG